MFYRAKSFIFAEFMISFFIYWDRKFYKHNIGYDTMLNETIDLMKLVKAAIIYLINFVNTEEEKKKKANGKLILDMTVDTSQFL